MPGERILGGAIPRVGMTWTFRAKLYRPPGVGTWTLVPLPAKVVRDGGLRVRLRIAGTIDGAPFRSTILTTGGPGLFVVVPAPLRERIGKEAGATVAVSIGLDRAPRVVAVPRDLRTALAGRSSAAARFDALAPSHRKAFVGWIEAAVRPETRARRVAETVTMVVEGRRL